MASSKYVLKKGVVLQAFGHPEKVCTAKTITDELGDWYMEHFPEKAIYFDKLPSRVRAEVASVKQPVVVPKTNIVAPDPINIPDPLKIADSLTARPPEEELVKSEIVDRELKGTKPKRSHHRAKK